MFKPSNAVINGQFLKKNNDQLVSIYSPSFQYGLTVFEGIRLYFVKNELKPFLLEEHVTRLLRSWKLLGLGDVTSKEVIFKDINILLKNAKAKNNIYLKYLVGYLTEGSWSTFEKPDRLCFFYRSESIFEKNEVPKAKASISSIKRINSNSLAANIKCGANYINSRLAYMDVQTNKNTNTIPIMLNEAGMIAESSGTSLFIIKDKEVITPSLSADILPSITREYLLKYISKKINSINFKEANISRWDIYDADAVFLVGTAAELIELSEIDLYQYKPNNIILNKIYKEFRNYIFQ
tara:strand:- start:6059 stop:6940 length:882 start_codon:yes stop_codon:yes gene_type:complete